MDKSFYSNGKLLLTGEYAVLDGALSLAVPTSRGQSLSVQRMDLPRLQWTSRDEKEGVWFEASFDITSSEVSHIEVENDSPLPLDTLDALDSPININLNKPSETRAIAKTLSKILSQAKELNPNFLSNTIGYRVETKLDFPRDWGLGSSSTLINNIAQWAEVDAYQLLWKAFSGSGYDIACARHDRPILYRLDKKPQEIGFYPSFHDQLYFVHLNRKQNSREGIAKYRQQDFNKSELVEKISEITQSISRCQQLAEFELLLTKHEALISKDLQIPTVKESLFPDFHGTLKSLGAWGGDFILATGGKDVTSYFEKKGFRTVIPYAEMVLDT